MWWKSTSKSPLPCNHACKCSVPNRKQTWKFLLPWGFAKRHLHMNQKLSGWVEMAGVLLNRKILSPSAKSNLNKWIPQMLWSESNASLLCYDFFSFPLTYSLHLPQNDLRQGELQNNLGAMKDLMPCSTIVCWHRRLNLGLLLEGQFSYSPSYTIGRCTKNDHSNFNYI